MLARGIKVLERSSASPQSFIMVASLRFPNSYATVYRSTPLPGSCSVGVSQVFFFKPPLNSGTSSTA